MAEVLFDLGAINKNMLEQLTKRRIENVIAVSSTGKTDISNSSWTIWISQIKRLCLTRMGVGKGFES